MKSSLNPELKAQRRREEIRDRMGKDLKTSYLKDRPKKDIIKQDFKTPLSKYQHRGSNLWNEGIGLRDKENLVKPRNDDQYQRSHLNRDMRDAMSRKVLGQGRISSESRPIPIPDNKVSLTDIHRYATFKKNQIYCKLVPKSIRDTIKHVGKVLSEKTPVSTLKGEAKKVKSSTSAAPGYIGSTSPTWKDSNSTYSTSTVFKEPSGKFNARAALILPCILLFTLLVFIIKLNFFSKVVKPKRGFNTGEKSNKFIKLLLTTLVLAFLTIGILLAKRYLMLLNDQEVF